MLLDFTQELRVLRIIQLLCQSTIYNLSKLNNERKIDNTKSVIKEQTNRYR